MNQYTSKERRKFNRWNRVAISNV